jgi:hypothetical protein
LTAVLAIVFGAISLSKIKKNPEKYKGIGFAKAGLIIGIIEIVLIIAIFALLVAALGGLI